jgi:hypothetical protein
MQKGGSLIEMNSVHMWTLICNNMPAMAKLAAHEKYFRSVVEAGPLSDLESVSAAVQRAATIAAFNQSLMAASLVISPYLGSGIPIIFIIPYWP